MTTDERISQMEALLISFRNLLTVSAADAQDFHCRVRSDKTHLSFEVMTKDRMAGLANFTVESYFQDRKLCLRVNVTCTVCNHLSEARLTFRALTLVMELGEKVDALCQTWNQGQV